MSGSDLRILVENLKTHQVELEMQNEELTRAQQMLAQEKEKYCDLFDFAPVGFLAIDKGHLLTECNLTAAGMLGVERAKLLRRPLRRYVAREDRDAFTRFLMQTRAEQRGLMGEVRILRADGRMFHARLESEPVRGGDGVRLAMVDISDRVDTERDLMHAKQELELNVQQRTGELRSTVEQLFAEIAQREKRERELHATYEELNLRAQQLQRLTSQLVQTEQRERKRIAQVLHDTLQQQLAAVRLLVGGLADRSPDEQWKEELVRAEEQIGDSIRTARTLTTELNPPALTQGGLIGGLEWLARWMEQKHGLRVELSFENRRLDMSEDTKMLLFDSVRELLFNVAKHADAPLARVGLETSDGAGLKITVSDQGRGFDPKALPARPDPRAGSGCSRSASAFRPSGGGCSSRASPVEAAASRFTSRRCCRPPATTGGGSA